MFSVNKDYRTDYVMLALVDEMKLLTLGLVGRGFCGAACGRPSPSLVVGYWLQDVHDRSGNSHTPTSLHHAWNDILLWSPYV